MFTTSATRWLFAFAALTSGAMPMHAQPETPRKYVEFKIDPQFEKMLKNRMQMEKQLGPLKDLMKKIAADPDKLFDKDKFKDLKLDDPKFKLALQDWIASDPKMQEALREWLKIDPPGVPPADLKKFQNELKNILDKSTVKLPDASQVPPPLPLPKDATPKADPGLIAKATERAMKQAENSKLGDWLHDSPAWKRAFEDLSTSMNNPDLPRFRLGDWQDKLRLPEGKAWQLGEGVLDRLPKLPRPDLERFKLPGMNVNMPNVAAPALPNVSGPSLPTVSVGMTWLLLLLLVMLLGWQMLRWTKPSTDVVDERTQLGPCPVQLDAVSTRAELVQAFDYLALLTLGLRVRSWNHRAVSLLWREQAPPCTESALALAALYEQARYTEGADQLSETERDTARRSLHQLAEAL